MASFVANAFLLPPRAAGRVELAALASVGTQNGALHDFILGSSKATNFVNSIWKQFAKPGDLVVDATCGNGNDTLMLTKLVCSEFSSAGLVYGFDIQQAAIQKTYELLDEKLSSEQRKQVRLFQTCHSKMHENLEDARAKLIVFNLGYLPGGDKEFTTRPCTTIKALEQATELLLPGGLLSIVSYVGHPGGREEFTAVENFAASLPAKDWTCSHVQYLNRPSSPRTMFLVRK